MSGLPFFRNKLQVYQLWQTATSYHIRPSDLLNIPADLAHEVLRFEIDNAVAGLGNYIDGKLQEMDAKGRRKYKTLAAVLALALPLPVTPRTASAGGFPKMNIKKRVKA